VSPALGILLAVAGVVVIVSSRPVGTLLVRAQPRAMYPGHERAKVGRAILRVIGAGMVLAGLVDALDVVGWLLRPR